MSGVQAVHQAQGVAEDELFEIDVRVYEPAGVLEVPFLVPLSMRDGQVLKTGYHTMVGPERLVQVLRESDQGVLKVVGVTRVTPETAAR